jgi:hypothetical protein
MKKEDLYNSIDSVVPNEVQKSRMLRKILSPKMNSVRTRPKKLVIALITAFCLIGTTVIATNIPAFQSLLEKISPDTAKFIEPVEEVCVDQGIKMEVVAVARYDNMVKAYITLQDLEGDRIGEDLSFLDYFSIKGAWSGRWSLIDFDKENKKATLFVEAENDTKFEGENLIFKVENIFYDHKEYEDYEIGLDLNKISHDSSYINATTEQFMSWSHGKLYGGLLSEEQIVPILFPHDIDFKFPDIKTSMISNIGVIDGILHVQVWRDTAFDGQGVSIYLKDSKGERIDADTTITFMLDELKKIKNPEYSYYSEYIFDINTDNLDAYKLFGDFSTSKQLKGNWEVSFKAEDSEIIQLSDIEIDEPKSMKIEKIGVNPFGVTISGNRNIDAEAYEFDVKINTQTDTIQASIFSSTWEDLPYDTKEKYSDFILIYDIEKPIDLNLITSITIDGVEVPIK